MASLDFQCWIFKRKKTRSYYNHWLKDERPEFCYQSSQEVGWIGKHGTCGWKVPCSRRVFQVGQSSFLISACTSRDDNGSDILVLNSIISIHRKLPLQSASDTILEDFLIMLEENNFLEAPSGGLNV